MTNDALTPGRLREAAEVATQLGWVRSADDFRNCADHLEREQAVEARRDKRIEELLAVPDLRLMRRQALVLIDRYPSLLDEPKDEK